MRIINYIILIFLLNVCALSQQQTESTEDECVVSVKEYRNAKSLYSKKRQTNDKELGRFTPDNSESGFTQKRFRIPQSQLFVFANVYYDDNMLYDGYLHDAITITLVVSRNKKLSSLSTISVATIHAQYEDFAQVSVIVLARSGSKLFDAQMICRRKQRTQ